MESLWLKSKVGTFSCTIKVYISVVCGFKFYTSVPLDLFLSFVNHVVFVAQSSSQGQEMTKKKKNKKKGRRQEKVATSSYFSACDIATTTLRNDLKSLVLLANFPRLKSHHMPIRHLENRDLLAGS